MNNENDFKLLNEKISELKEYIKKENIAFFTSRGTQTNKYIETIGEGIDSVMNDGIIKDSLIQRKRILYIFFALTLILSAISIALFSNVYLKKNSVNVVKVPVEKIIYKDKIVEVPVEKRIEVPVEKIKKIVILKDDDLITYIYNSKTLTGSVSEIKDKYKNLSDNSREIHIVKINSVNFNINTQIKTLYNIIEF